MYPAKPINPKTISIRLVSIGFFLIGLGAIVFSDTWIRSSDLFICRGTVETVDCITTTKTTTTGIKRRSKSSYRQADLIFRLHTHNHAFMLSEDIGQDDSYPPFIEMRDMIKASEVLSVGIYPDEQTTYTPRVLEIKNNKGVTLYALADATSGSRTGFLISAIAGLIFICTGIVYILPPAIKRKSGFNFNETRSNIKP